MRGRDEEDVVVEEESSQEEATPHTSSQSRQQQSGDEEETDTQYGDVIMTHYHILHFRQESWAGAYLGQQQKVCSGTLACMENIPPLNMPLLSVDLVEVVYRLVQPA